MTSRIPEAKRKTILLRDGTALERANRFEQIEDECKQAITALTTLKKESYFGQRSENVNVELIATCYKNALITIMMIGVRIGNVSALGDTVRSLNELLGEGVTVGHEEEGAEPEEGASEERPQLKIVKPKPEGTSLDAPEAEEDDEKKPRAAKRRGRAQDAQGRDQSPAKRARAGSRRDEGKPKRSSKGSSPTRKRGPR